MRCVGPSWLASAMGGKLIAFDTRPNLSPSIISHTSATEPAVLLDREDSNGPTTEIGLLTDHGLLRAKLKHNTTQVAEAILIICIAYWVGITSEHPIEFS